MTVHHFNPDHFYSTFGDHQPVLMIADGDSVMTKTIDAFGVDDQGRNVASGSNPQTGPFYVEGAVPGDTVQVFLDRLYPNREKGYSSTAIAPNVVDPAFVNKLPERGLVEWRIDPVSNTATHTNSGLGIRSLKLSLMPMLGCLGVAPAEAQAISTSTSGSFGGNMDYRGFVTGVSAYFPVFVPGALIYLGDGHAVQGDGEIAGTGIEVSFDVQFTVHLLKGKRIQWPRGEDNQYIFTVGNARPLEQALQHATTEMLRWLGEDYGLGSTEVSTFLGQCVEYDLGNVFDPAYTMVCKVSKKLLDSYKA